MARKLGSHSKDVSTKTRKKLPSLRRRDDSNTGNIQRRARSPQNNPYDADESDSEELPSEYPIQVCHLPNLKSSEFCEIISFLSKFSVPVIGSYAYAAYTNCSDLSLVG